MTESPETAQAGMADALHDLSENSRVLVRHEINAAQREMWDKAKESAPAFGLVAVAGALGLFAAAASYRLTLRLFEKVLPPVPAAFIAATAFGTGAAYTATVAARQLRNLPPLLPTGTAQHAGEALAGTAAQASEGAPSGPHTA
jgi:hypothetical protein